MNLEKINALKQWMENKEIDLSYVSNPQSIAYFTGYHSDPHERVLGLFIALDQEPFLFTPALEEKAASHSSWAYDVVSYLDTENPWKVIKEEVIARFGQPKTIALEKNALSLDRFEQLASYFNQTNFQPDLTPVIQKMQLIKTKNEIQGLIEAGTWADVAFDIGFSMVDSAVTEQEIVAQIEYELKKKGIAKMSFDTMVLSGARAADPHGIPGNIKLQDNQLVLFDLGVIYNGYCSDATRTIALKKPTDFQKEIYQIVLEAQLTAQEAVKPGITAGELDAIARKVIDDAGYGPYFNHRLGHGIGTSVHEYPSIVAGNDLVIEEGMCFSIEPGIYLPNQVGVRIEDCVYVTKNGSQPFTKTSKELTILH